MSIDRLTFRGPFAPLRAIPMYCVAILRPFVRPALYLWPWILGVGVFGALVNSPQGTALAESYSEETYRLDFIIGSIVASWLAVVVASLLALMAASIREPLQRIEGPAAHVKSMLEVFAGGLWIVAVSSAYGVLFAQSVHIVAAWLAVGSLAVVGAIATGWMACSAGEETSAAAQVFGAIQRHHFLVISLALLLAIAPLALGALVCVSNPIRLADAGPLLVGMVGISAISTLLGVILVVVPLYLRRPWVGVAFVAAMAGWAVLQPLPIDRDNPLLRDDSHAAYRNNEEDPTCQKIPYGLDSSLEAHTTSPQFALPMLEFDRSIYLVSAEGGGIRAAYWTALNLAQLDISTRGKFGEEVASLSGVSGGSLGIATWLAARDRVDLSAQARLELVAQFLSSDFLSPLLGGLLFLDVPRLLLGPMWPSARRDHVFEKALVDQWQLIGRSDFFAREMQMLCLRGFTKVPAVYFNATDALTGAYVPLPYSSFPPVGSSEYVSLDREPLGLYSSVHHPTVAQVVHFSARFPYLSPEAPVGINASTIASEDAYKELYRRRQAASLTEREEEDLVRQIEERRDSIEAKGVWSRHWVLVDGGYFDNTGLTPTKKAMAYIEWQRAMEAGGTSNEARPYTRTRTTLVHISNDPGTPCLPLSTRWQERLSARAKRFVELAKGGVRCAHEVAALEDSLVQSLFYPLVVPFQSLLNVRGEQARQKVAELRARYAPSPHGHAWLREISLAAEFAEAYAMETERDKRNLVQPAAARTQEAERQVAKVREEVERLVRNGKATQPSANAYLNEVSEWLDMVRNEARQADCHAQFKPVAPPLGWTLSKSNQALMRCLSTRQGIANRLIDPLSYPAWPIIWAAWNPWEPWLFFPSELRPRVPK
jgi:hypothetical protein